MLLAKSRGSDIQSALLVCGDARALTEASNGDFESLGSWIR